MIYFFYKSVIFLLVLCFLRPLFDRFWPSLNGGKINTCEMNVAAIVDHFGEGAGEAVEMIATNVQNVDVSHVQQMVPGQVGQGVVAQIKFGDVGR